MDRQLIQYYLQQSGMQPPQAEMLSAIFGEMATRGEVQVLQHSLERQMHEIRSEMREHIGEVRAELRDVRAEMGLLRAELSSEMKGLEARLTWRFIVGIAFFASVMTVLDVFVD